jgi:RNA polymerase sigma-70 factor (ECF subfamily)
MSDEDTSLSLLDKLIRQPDSESWTRLADIYSPLLRGWLGRYGIQSSDVDDLVQEVLLTVSRELPGFEHCERPGAFRSWLRTILVHRLRNFWRSRRYHPTATGGRDVMRQLDELADQNSTMSRVWNQQHDQHVVDRVLELIEPKVAPKTWEAFRRQSIEGAAAHVVARELGMSLDAVYGAKSRVLKMLRQQAQGLID